MARIDALSVAELEQILTERKEELSELQARRESLTAELATCEARIADLLGSGSGSVSSKAPKTAKVARRQPKRRRPRNQPSLKSIIQDILQKSKKPMTLDEIIEKVNETGYRSKAKDFRQVAYLNLFNMKKNGEVLHDSETKQYRAAA